MSASLIGKVRRRSPASLILDRHGISQRKLARALGVSHTSLSRALQGRQPIPDGFTAALRAVIGAEGVAQILAAIEETAE